MLLEVLNVLGVGEVLELGVLVVVSASVSRTAPGPDRRRRGRNSLLPVVDLVLVLVVAVVAGPGAHVRQGLALALDDVDKLIARDAAVAVLVEQRQDVAHDLVLADEGDLLVRLVHQAVCAQDLVVLPVAVAVEVVKREEGGRIEAGGVVLLWGE